MYLTLTLHISLLHLFFLLAHAAPIKPLEHSRGLAHQKRTSYSIVAIDGSSPPPLSTTTTPIIRTVTQTIDDTKTVTVLPSTSTSLKKVIASAQVITEPAPPKLVTPISTIISISTLRITAVELKTSASIVTQYASETIQPSASYDIVNPAEETTAPPEESLSRQSPTLSVANNTETASATTTKTLPSLRSSSTSYQASMPTSATHSSQSSISSASFGTGSWNRSCRYLNNTSSTARQPCKAAASTGTANGLQLIKP